MMAVSRSTYVPGGIIPSLKGYYKKKILFKILLWWKPLSAHFCMKKFGSSKAMKYSCAVINKREKEIPMLLIVKVLLLLPLKGHADRLERKKAFLQHMDRTRLLDGVEKEHGCTCFRWSTTSEIDHTMGEGDNKVFFVGEWIGLELMSTMRDVVHVDRRIYSLKPF